ncbi:MAG: O-antigen ligase family protein [Pseudomonadota bacterium]
MNQSPLAEDHFSRAGGAVSVVFAALPFAAIGGGLGLAPAAVIAGIVAAPWQRLPRAAREGGFALLLFAGFLGWCALSLAWSSQPLPTFLPTLAFGALAMLLVLGAGFERAADLDLAQRAAFAGLALSIALIAIEISYNYPVARAIAPPAPGGAGYGIEIETGALQTFAGRALSLAALWIWPVAAMLHRYRWPGWIGIALMTGALAWLCRALPNIVIMAALAVGLAPALLALRWPRRVVTLTAVSIAACLVAAPGVSPTLAVLAGQGWRAATGGDPPFALLARVDTWSYATGLIRQKPIWGWGLGASRAFDETHTIAGFSTPYIPGNPQSAPMQIWLETGAVGAVLAAAALAALGRRAGDALAEDRLAAAAASGAMATAFLIAALGEFSVWAIWWWAGLAICAAMVRVSRRAP